ncbi:SEC-C motif-containing protein [Hathewaya proteolytica DSM 3090]|uniref:SEC-C motif-containing protein n=1 Tax=Hathewaya proteolytica DSM 3090 TaxID=1121331 RepID=A0A1M6KJR4_9CLOT|nr:SEC-C metal-binding domain-containing protein [Hathewaya proteolytica]SHJ59185.1 SEC-C motif-containing protein [Hathewaya proteolytica DSM 3090]
MENRVLKEECVSILDKHLKVIKPDDVLLEDELANYTKEHIKGIAKKYRLTKISSLRKGELINKTVCEMLQAETMERAFIHLRDMEMTLLEKIMLHREGYNIAENEESLLSRIKSSFYVLDRKDGTAFVPADVVSLYNKINTEEYIQKRRIVSWLIDCFKVAAEFYGAVPLDVMVNVVNRHKNIFIDEEQLMEYYGQIPQEFNSFSFINGQFVLENFTEVQGDKKFYIPTEIEIEEIALNGYIASDKHVQKLMNFFSENMGIDNERISCVIRKMQSAMRHGSTINEVYSVINEQKVYFESEQQVKQMVSLINEMWNNTRMMKNRGFKPTECVITKNKVGRNDLCPCGSGKKYKKCCGRQ